MGDRLNSVMLRNYLSRFNAAEHNDCDAAMPSDRASDVYDPQPDVH